MCLWCFEIMPSLSVSLSSIFAQVLVIYCHFEAKRLILNFHRLEFCLKSFYELHMSFNGFMWMRMSKPHFESKFQSDRQNWFFISLHIVFQISFKNSNGQKKYRKVLCIRSELLLSILVISRFGFDGWSLVLIASVLDLCILFTSSMSFVDGYIALSNKSKLQWNTRFYTI